MVKYNLVTASDSDLLSAAVNIKEKNSKLNLFLSVLAGLCLLLSLSTFFTHEFANFANISTSVYPITVVSVLLFAALIRPHVVNCCLTICFLSYLSYYDVFSLVGVTWIYVLSMGLNAWLLSAGVSSYLAKNNSELSGLRAISAIFVFVVGIFLHAFILLGIHCFKPEFLLVPAALLALALSYYKKDLIRSDIRAFKTRFDVIPSAQDSFYFSCLCMLALFSGLLYLYPGAIAGDSDKAYLALAKYFSRENALLLSDPEVLRDDIKGFPYFQEIYFAAGYLLSANFGAKLLAWLLIPFKFTLFYFVAKDTLKLSKESSKLAVVLFALIPIFIELNSIERPENILMLTALAIFYFAEYLSGLLEKQENRDLNQALLDKSFLAIGVLFCISFSTKYTAFYLLVAISCVYWKLVFTALRSIVSIVKSTWFFLFPAIGICAFWYLRNLVLWGQIVSLQPFSRYHLTVFFPPLRTFSDIYDFIGQGFIATANYTEFANFGYGIFGIIIIPLAIYALKLKAPASRCAGIFLIYAFCLLISTRQIRYFAPVTPFAYLAAFLSLAYFFKSLFLTLFRFREALFFSLILLQASVAIVVNYNQTVGVALRERINLNNKDFSKIQPNFSQVNDIVKYPARILTSAYDANYSLDASLLRIDPVWSLAELARKIEQPQASHILLAGPGHSAHGFAFFDDLEFFDSVFQKELYAGNLFLFKIKGNRLKELVQYCKEQGWDLEQTVLVSREHKARFPHELVLGEEILLPHLKTKLYRLSSIWWSNNNLKFYQQTPEFIQGEVIASFFEDVTEALSPHAISAKIILNKTIKEKESIFEIKRKNSAVNSGSVTYLLDLAEAKSEPVVVEVYARVRTAGLDEFSINGEKSFLRAVDSLNKWQAIYEKELSSEAKKIRLDFKLLSNETRLRDIRVILRRPHQRYQKLPFPEQFLDQGKFVLNLKKTYFLREDFESYLKTSPQIELHTERNNVIATKDKTFGGSMMQANKEHSAFKKYIFKVPQEIENNAALKLYLMGNSGQGAINIILKTKNKIISSKTLEHFSAQAPEFIAEVSNLKGEIELELSMSEGSRAVISDFFLALGAGR